MNHARVRSLLGDYMEGDLSTADYTALDGHLSGCPTCSQELRELRSVVGLVRGLPDPEPPSDLAASVMARIEAGEGARSLQLIRGGLRRVAQPRWAAALAAGVAGLLAWTLAPSPLPDLGIPSDPDRAPVEAAANPSSIPDPTSDPILAAGGPSGPDRRPIDWGRSSAVSSLASASVPLRPAAFGVRVAPDAPVFEGDEIDLQLERLTIDPVGTLNRMRAGPGGVLFARVAQRAARRGSAAELAKRLIASRHPAAGGMVTRLLAASLAEDVQRHHFGRVPSLR